MTKESVFKEETKTFHVLLQLLNSLQYLHFIQLLEPLNARAGVISVRLINGVFLAAAAAVKD